MRQAKGKEAQSGIEQKILTRGQVKARCRGPISSLKDKIMEKSFGEFAREKRRQSDFKIADCAKALNIKSAAYQHKETSTRGWSLEDVINLATLYSLTPSQLLAEWEQWVKA